MSSAAPAPVKKKKKEIAKPTKLQQLLSLLVADDREAFCSLLVEQPPPANAKSKSRSPRAAEEAVPIDFNAPVVPFMDPASAAAADGAPSDLPSGPHILLNFAVRLERQYAVQALLALPDVVACLTDDPSENTPLILATMSKNMEIFELLLHLRPEPAQLQINHRNAEGISALDYAVSMHLEEAAQQLVARQADFPWRRAVFEAARADSIDHFKFLLQLQSTAVRLFEEDACLSLAHVAVERKSVQLLQLLQELKAGFVAVDKQGRTPLDMALEADWQHFWTTLPHTCTTSFLNRTYRSLTNLGTGPFTPLHHAVFSENLPLLEQLLKLGASVDCVDAAEGNPPLFMCSSWALPDDLLASEEKPTPQSETRLKIVKRLLAASPQLSLQNKSGQNILHRLAACGRRSGMGLVLEAAKDAARGLCAAQEGRFGDTPLHVAARHDQIDVIRFLKAQGLPASANAAASAASSNGSAVVVDIEAANKLGQTPLEVAAYCKKAAAAYVLVKECQAHCGRIIASSPSTGPQTTLLHQILRLCGEAGEPAAAEGDADRHWTMLDVAEAIVDIRLASMRALEEFEQKRREEEAALAADPKKGAKPKADAKKGAGGAPVEDAAPVVVELPLSVAEETEMGCTPLMLVIERNLGSLLPKLLQASADLSVLAYPRTRKWTMVHLCAAHGRAEMLAFLLQTASQLMGHGFDAPDADGMTPLLLAANHGHADCVEHLLRHGANVEAIDNLSRNVLHLACWTGRLSLVQGLLAMGESAASMEAQKRLISGKDAAGRTPLHVAAYGGSRDLVRTLLERGADKFTEDRILEIPLISATHGGNVHTAELLLLADRKREQKALS